MFFVNIKYQSKMLESTQAIIEYMEKQKFDQASLGLSLLQQKSVLGDDPLLISRNFSAIAYNLKFLIFYTLIIFILLNGFIWFLTCNLINKNFKSLKINIKNLFNYIFKFGLIALIFSFLAYLIAFSTLESSLNPFEETQKSSFAPLLLVPVLFYFMYLAFPLLNKVQFKNILKNLFNLGIKKAHIVLLADLLTILIISVFSFLLFYLAEQNIFLVFVSTILLTLSFVWSRIFLALVVDKLNNYSEA